MLLDEWGGGYRVVQGQNEEVEASPTFQQLGDNPEQVEEVEDFLDYPSLDDNDLSKIKAFEEVVDFEHKPKHSRNCNCKINIATVFGKAFSKKTNTEFSLWADLRHYKM